MKLLTTNFLTCAVKDCRGHADAYPLDFQECQLQRTPLDVNAPFLRGIVSRIEWPALVQVCRALGNSAIPDATPDMDDEAVVRSLHEILMETSIRQGKMQCRRCGHTYLIKEGIANMLLAEHEV